MGSGEPNGVNFMRLLMVTQDFPPVVGGIQTYSYQLALRFAMRCEAFEVIAPSHPESASVDDECPFRVTRVPVSSNGMRVAVLPWLIAAARRGRFDTVFLAQWYTGAAGNIARRLGFVERVFSAAHGQELLRVPAPDSAFGRWYERHRKSVVNGVDGFFPVSHYTGTLLEADGVPSDRIHVANNGTNPERFALGDRTPETLQAWRQAHGLGQGPLLLTVSRIVERKGIDLVLRAMPALLQSFPTLRYAVVGGGPELENLENLAIELGVSDNAHFLGKIPEEDLLTAYHACDIFVMPARLVYPSVEGFGLVFREANACGKPVIGTRSGGIPDAIVDGETGLLIDPDDLEALIESTLTLLRDPEAARAMGQKGKTLVETKGTWSHVADQILDTMESHT